MIHLQVPRLEVRGAPGAVTFLMPIERRPVRPVRRKLAQVGAFGDVGAVHSLVEQPELIVHPALQMASIKSLEKRR